MKTETDLLNAAESLEGLSFHQLAVRLGIQAPTIASSRKGWLGAAMEVALGGQVNSRSGPDFAELGIELKTLPINSRGKPAESTFVTGISLLTLHRQNWETSTCFAKLRRMLWVLIEGDRTIPFPERRIGPAILWSPSVEDEAVLKQDWLELTGLMTCGRLDEVHAGLGTYLQVRPKAADAQALTYAYDAQGEKQQTLPRGFYLRASFTEKILLTHL